MPGHCAARDCPTTRTSGKNVHRFPLSKPELLQLWIENTGRQFTPKSTDFLFSEHFTKAPISLAWRLVGD